MLLANAYTAARERAAVIDRSDRGYIVVSGADRASYLQGLLTNDIAALGPGAGCYAAYLTPQGRMITDLFVYELGDVILLNMPRSRKETVLAKLDQFIFSEDVQLVDATDVFAAASVIGPEAGRILTGILAGDLTDIESWPAHANRRVQFQDHAAILARSADAGEPGYDVYIERGWTGALRQALESAGVVEADAETAAVIRIEAGIPKFNEDMGEETIPLEAGIEGRAISFSKGCYVGQEVIIRVLHRGHGRVAKKLVGMSIDGPAVPAPGTSVTTDAREIGHVTSSAFSPALRRPIALGYLHRDFLSAGTTVTVGGQTATVTELPFVK